MLVYYNNGLRKSGTPHIIHINRYGALRALVCNVNENENEEERSQWVCALRWPLGMRLVGLVEMARELYS